MKIALSSHTDIQVISGEYGHYVSIQKVDAVNLTRKKRSVNYSLKTWRKVYDLLPEIQRHVNDEKEMAAHALSEYTNQTISVIKYRGQMYICLEKKTDGRRLYNSSINIGKLEFNKLMEIASQIASEINKLANAIVEG